MSGSVCFLKAGKKYVSTRYTSGCMCVCVYIYVYAQETLTESGFLLCICTREPSRIRVSSIWWCIKLAFTLRSLGEVRPGD